jgi:hypothetical protein
MRLFEFCAVLCVFISVISSFINPQKRHPWRGIFPLASLVFIILTAIIEKFRWQLAPVALLVILIFFLNIRTILHRLGLINIERKNINKYLRALATTLGLIILLIGVIPLLMFPVFSLPEPTGPYLVGTRYFVLKEVYVQVWYPAE